MYNGWVKLHRDIINSEVFNNPKILKFWIWALVKASYKEHKQIVGLQTVVLNRGQFIFGRKKASIELDMSESSTYKILKKLEHDNKIRVISNNKFSIVTILKWDDYQETESKTNIKETHKGQQKSTNKKSKEREDSNQYLKFTGYE